MYGLTQCRTLPLISTVSSPKVNTFGSVWLTVLRTLFSLIWIVNNLSCKGYKTVFLKTTVS